MHRFHFSLWSEKLLLYILVSVSIHAVILYSLNRSIDFSISPPVLDQYATIIARFIDSPEEESSPVPEESAPAQPAEARPEETGVYEPEIEAPDQPDTTAKPVEARTDTPEIPEVDFAFIETMDPEGPAGAKGIGEAPAICTAAAIANAFYNATGVRIYELPFTPEKVLRALKAAAGEKVE